jgi:steroid delta-isomerase-like uncharacterized protein
MSEHHKELLKRHLMAENSHDLDGTLATLHPGCIFRDHATGQVWHGRDGAADHYRQWWNAFDVAVTRGAGQSSWWASETAYVAEATWQGPHIGPFLGIEATRRVITQPFLVVVGFKDGLMNGETFYYDLGSIARQLGVERFPELATLPHRVTKS